MKSIYLRTEDSFSQSLNWRQMALQNRRIKTYLQRLAIGKPWGGAYKSYYRKIKPILNVQFNVFCQMNTSLCKWQYFLSTTYILAAAETNLPGKANHWSACKEKQTKREKKNPSKHTQEEYNPRGQSSINSNISFALLVPIKTASQRPTVLRRVYLCVEQISSPAHLTSYSHYSHLT